LEQLKKEPAALQAASSTQRVGAATLTIEELAALLKISVAHTYKGLKDGKIPTIRLGTRYIISTSAIMRWLDEAPLERHVNQVSPVGDSKKRFPGS